MNLANPAPVFRILTAAAALASCPTPSWSAPHEASKKEFCEIIALSGRLAYVDRLKGRPLPAVSANKKRDFFYPLAEYARDFGCKTAKCGAEAEEILFAKCMANSDYAMQQFDRGNQITSAQLPR